MWIGPARSGLSTSVLSNARLAQVAASQDFDAVTKGDPFSGFPADFSSIAAAGHETDTASRQKAHSLAHT